MYKIQNILASFLYSLSLGFGMLISDPLFANASTNVSPSDENILGNPNSQIVIVEYADYQCPYCVQYFKTIEEQLKKDYVDTGKVKLKFVNVQFLGPESVAAGTAAECAKEQGQFWPYHDALFQAKLQDFRNGGGEEDGFYNRSLFIKLAQENHLNVEKFRTCYDSNKYVRKIQKEADAANNAGVNGTPAIFVNGQRVENSLSYNEIQRLIQKAQK